MALQASGIISASQIANEFGYNHPLSGSQSGKEVSLGNYRKIGFSQSNYPQSIGELNFSSIDGSGSVPTSGEIAFSDFYSTRLQTVVNFWSSGAGGTRLVAKERYNENGNIGVHGHVAVVGGFRARPNDSSGTKVHIHVNQEIGSEKTRVEHCALRTGDWDSSTTLQVDVGGSGRIGGAGGDGGNGGDPYANANSNGGSGTSGLGVEYTPTRVNVASGGVITAGFGGGGAGGGAYDTDKEGSRTASGGGGGGGAGIPAGAGGSGGTGASENANGGPGNAGSVSEGGLGGSNASNDGEAVSGNGGPGGEASQSAQEGATGTGGEGSTYGGGDPGSAGAAIRKTSSSITVNVNIASSGSVNGVQDAISVL